MEAGIEDVMLVSRLDVMAVVWQGRGHWKDKMLLVFFELRFRSRITHQMIISCKDTDFFLSQYLLCGTNICDFLGKVVYS